MPVISLQDLSGMTPIRDASLLPVGAASFSVNAFLYSGAVQGFREANPVHRVQTPGVSSVYRIPRTADPVPDFESSLWLEFFDPYMAVARAPVIEDEFQRYYFFPSDQAADNSGPYYNTYDRLNAGQPGYKLGIPTPEHAPVVDHLAGTSATQEVRTYLYTWASQFGEEGPPSPPTTLLGTVDGIWTIGVTPPPAGVTEQRDLVSVHLYRTVVGSDGSVNYFLVDKFPITQTTYTDELFSSDITSNTILPSTSFTPPPQDLQGVVTMANGILAGWSNTREIWFCEPYRPHAWPAAYVVVVGSPIVALAAVGSSLIILTHSTPWVATGVTPASITLGKIESREPCISRGGVTAAGEGVYYASPNGLIVVNTMGTQNVTQPFIDKHNWSTMGIETFACSRYAAAFVAFSKGSKLRNNGIIVDHQTPNTLFSWLSSGEKIVNVYCDEFSGSTFLLTETDVIEWNPSEIEKILPYTWVSREFRFPYPQQFAAGNVYFVVPEVLKIPVPSDATRNTSQNQDLDPTKQYLLLKVYADGRLVVVRELQKSGELILLPSGFKATYWRFEFQGQVILREAEFATSVKELMAA